MTILGPYLSMAHPIKMTNMAPNTIQAESTEEVAAEFEKTDASPVKSKQEPDPIKYEAKKAVEELNEKAERLAEGTDEDLTDPENETYWFGPGSGG